MNMSLLKSIRVWSVSVVILNGLAASILTVTPVYAASCTDSQCGTALIQGIEFCDQFHVLPLTFTCPVPGQPNEWHILCKDGHQETGNCS